MPTKVPLKDLPSVTKTVADIENTLGDDGRVVTLMRKKGLALQRWGKHDQARALQFKITVL